MVTRKDVLDFLDGTLLVLTDIREILAILPDYETLLQHLHAFKCFLEKNSDHE